MLVVDEWNTHNAPESRLENVVTDWLGAAGAVLALFEVWTKHADLKAVAKRHRLILVTENPGNRKGIVQEAGSTAILINPRQVKFARFKVLVMKTRWKVFSHNRVHEGRRFIRVRFRRDGDKVKFTAMHFPTLGHDGPNKKAFNECLDILERSLRSTPDDVTEIIVGDGNDTVRFFRQWAHKVSPDIQVDGTSPEIVMVKNGKILFTAELAKSGSDHHRMRAAVETGTL